MTPALDRPILLPPDLIPALLAGRVTLLRRPQAEPYAKGDILWVKERAYVAPANNQQLGFANRTDHLGRARLVGYDATLRPSTRYVCEDKAFPRLCAADLPKWASRFRLLVREIDYRPLSTVTEAEVRAEGLRAWSKDGNLYKWSLPDREDDAPLWTWSELHRDPVLASRELWKATLRNDTGQRPRRWRGTELMEEADPVVAYLQVELTRGLSRGR